jgi:hypothetical protein
MELTYGTVTKEGGVGDKEKIVMFFCCGEA